jgi:ribosome biogenesis GTPase / thiamine phosphate phosphatase
MNTLLELGWDNFYQQAFDALLKPELAPARIISQQKNSFRILTARGELESVISGKMFLAGQSETFPAVGDWVAVRLPESGEIAPIEELLPRKSHFSRLAAGGNGRRDGGATTQQIVAANIDRVFIVSALDEGRGFNLRRLERYLTLSWNSGASPVLVLNKADLCLDIEAVLAEVAGIAQGVPVLTVSALQKQGLDLIRSHIGRGFTAAFIGPSGVGKSSLINSLLGTDTIKVNAVRDSDSAGHHTTTHRELFLLPAGGAVIDTPGMREIQLWSDEDSLDETFPDIRNLAALCRFTDCTHNAEPECAVQKAIETGELDFARYNNYLKMQKELRYLDARQNGRVRIEEKARWRKIALYQKQIHKPGR